MWLIEPVTGLIETAVSPEFYIDGIGAAELIKGCVRLYLFSEKMPLDAQIPHKVIALKAVAPMISIPILMAQLARCLSDDRPDGGFPRLVR